MDWASIVAAEGAALAAAAERDEDAVVPSCPGWTVVELVRHLGVIQARTVLLLRTGMTERPSRRDGTLPEAPQEAVLDWYRGTLDELVAQLGDLGDPDRPVWSFSPGQERAGFWPRRMAHETAVHRIDVEQAVGGPVAPVESALAVDGVDEILRTFVPAFAQDRSPGDGRTVHLHATDAEGEWLVTFEPGRVVVTDGHAKGDAAVRGSAGALYLWLWGRLPPDDLDVFGESSAAEALRAVTTF